ncbi:salivary glue protein Sgs-3-like [Mytilus edulis]|uniref:salivary glue protein Sgs-3-like n=1 Tax=Mytilus edulis TaxID=6550 RepID=UPI0039EDF6B5
MTTAETIPKDNTDSSQDIYTTEVETATVSVINITYSAKILTDTTSTVCAMITTDTTNTQSSTATAETRTNTKAASCTIKATITTDEKIASTAAFTTTDESITTLETPSIANAIKTAITTTPPVPTN